MTDELKASGILDRYGITIDLKNAQNEFSMAQTIVQDMVRNGYDYIITISTPALQATANGNKTIPHIFGAVTDPYRMGIATATPTISRTSRAWPRSSPWKPPSAL